MRSSSGRRASSSSRAGASAAAPEARSASQRSAVSMAKDSGSAHAETPASLSGKELLAEALESHRLEVGRWPRPGRGRTERGRRRARPRRRAGPPGPAKSVERLGVGDREACARGGRGRPERVRISGAVSSAICAASRRRWRGGRGRRAVRSASRRSVRPRRAAKARRPSRRVESSGAAAASPWISAARE